MIINYPTGLYGAAIAAVDGVPSNITFVVSNNPPPRTQLLFVKTPVGLSRKKRSPRIYTDAQRRAVVSKSVYSVIKSSNSTINSGMKQFEAGQIIEFDTAVNSATIDPMLVAPVTEIRHDTNLLDLTALGLDADLQSEIDSESEVVYKSLLSQLNIVIKRRADIEAEMKTTQKLLNEIDKTVDGLNGILDINPDNQRLVSARDELLAKKDTLLSQYDDLVSAANQAAADATTIRGKVNRVAQLIR